MLLSFIFITQILFAQTNTVLPKANFNPRPNPIPKSETDLVRDACLYATLSETDTCIKNYREERAFFNEASLDVCKRSYLLTMPEKKKCIELVKRRIFNISNLQACLDKGHRAKGIMPGSSIEVYTQCMQNKDNFATTEIPAGSANR